MSNVALVKQMREMKAECEKLAHAHEIATEQKCAQILLAAAGLSMLREKVAKQGGARV